VALSLGSRRVAVSNHRVLSSSDFPPDQGRNHGRAIASPTPPTLLYRVTLCEKKGLVAFGGARGDCPSVWGATRQIRASLNAPSDSLMAFWIADLQFRHAPGSNPDRFRPPRSARRQPYYAPRSARLSRMNLIWYSVWQTCAIGGAAPAIRKPPDRVGRSGGTPTS